jgi:hypothetical protein
MTFPKVDVLHKFSLYHNANILRTINTSSILSGYWGDMMLGEEANAEGEGGGGGGGGGKREEGRKRKGETRKGGKKRSGEVSIFFPEMRKENEWKRVWNGGTISLLLSLLSVVKRGVSSPTVRHG